MASVSLFVSTAPPSSSFRSKLPTVTAVFRIIYALRQVEAGVKIGDVCRQLGVSEQTYYRWKNQYAGLGVSELRRLKQLEEENASLKRLVADLSLDKRMLQEVLEKKSEACAQAADRGLAPRQLHGKPPKSVQAFGILPGQLLP